MNPDQILKASPAVAAPLRLRLINGAHLLTNPGGDYIFLAPEELERLMAGAVEPGDGLYERLSERNFIARELDTDRLAQQVTARKSFLGQGPHLHIVVPTLRCNETCVYCHASRADMSAHQTDMSEETAARTVDLILATTAEDVTIEFQGGEPLVNFDRVRFIVERAEEKNRQAGKRLQFALVSNLSLMDQEKLDFLLEHRVQVCTSIDGPRDLHNRQRMLAGGDCFEVTTRWMSRLNEAYADMGLDPMLYHVEALLTTTRNTLSRPKEVVDTYLELGCRSIFLRPMDPFGFARRSASKLSYTPEEFLGFYGAAMDYILELNLQGEQLLDRFAAIFLTKIIQGTEPNYLDLRSPCGAGIGQVVYNHDGRIFTCDEGRMVHAMGDGIFQIGRVEESTYEQVVGHEMVQACVVASNLDASPDCVNCVYSPYCGLCPVYNYVTQGSLQGRMRDSSLCAIFKGIQDYLFDKIREDSPDVLAILERWTLVRERAHFVHATTDELALAEEAPGNEQTT